MNETIRNKLSKWRSRVDRDSTREESCSEGSCSHPILVADSDDETASGQFVGAQMHLAAAAYGGGTAQGGIYTSTSG